MAGEVRAIYVEFDPGETEQVQKDWNALDTGVTLEVTPSPYRAYVSLLVSIIKRIKAEQKEGVVTVLLAEYVPTTLVGRGASQQLGMATQSGAALSAGHRRYERAVRVA